MFNGTVKIRRPVRLVIKMSLRSEPTRRSTRMRTLTTPAQEDYEARMDTFQ